ncbi:MAG: hypothetical protein R2834_16265 [Rhodothermales bacterium]
MNNVRAVQQSLGFSLSRFSPASAYQLAAMRLGRTDLGLKRRFTESLYAYRTAFTAYIRAEKPRRDDHADRRQRKGGAAGPERFAAVQPGRHDQSEQSPADLIILTLYAFGAVALALIAFNRYDVR